VSAKKRRAESCWGTLPPSGAPNEHAAPSDAVYPSEIETCVFLGGVFLRAFLSREDVFQ